MRTQRLRWTNQSERSLLDKVTSQHLHGSTNDQRLACGCEEKTFMGSSHCGLFCGVHQHLHSPGSTFIRVQVPGFSCVSSEIHRWCGHMKRVRNTRVQICSTHQFVHVETGLFHSAVAGCVLRMTEQVLRSWVDAAASGEHRDGTHNVSSVKQLKRVHRYTHKKVIKPHFPSNSTS